MTREEAIAILEVSKHMATSGRMYNQAIDMAIEALHREEAEEKGYCHRIKPKEYLKNDAIKPSNDVINRADAIEAVAKLQKYDLDERNRLRIYAPWHKPKRIFVETEAIYKTIYALPSADADVVRCKDCKYSFYDKDYESYNCRKHEYVELFDADDYCSWGERND